MTETDKLLVRIGTARDAISRKTEQTSLDYMIDGVLMNCSVLLKEQETQKSFDVQDDWFCVDKSGKITELAVVVRCKDCKNAEILSWLDNAIICKKHSYTGVRPDEFYCADGVKRDD